MSTEQIPADCLFEQAISALEFADASELRRLTDCALSVTTPLNQSRYCQNRELFAALLEATARNLRLLRRASDQGSSAFYLPALQ